MRQPHYLPGTEAEIAWAAGLFEGEGSISPQIAAGRTDRVVRVALNITSTDLDVLERFHRIVGCGHIRGPRQRKHYKPQWAWTVTKFEHSKAVLAAFEPWLLSRRNARAREVLEMQRQSQSEHRVYGDGYACSKGHVRSEHSYRGPRGYWVCRTCAARWGREQNERRKAAKAAL